MMKEGDKLPLIYLASQVWIKCSHGIRSPILSFKESSKPWYIARFSRFAGM
jgi:hypothetical protein